MMTSSEPRQKEDLSRSITGNAMRASWGGAD